MTFLLPEHLVRSYREYLAIQQEKVLIMADMTLDYKVIQAQESTLQQSMYKDEEI